MPRFIRRISISVKIFGIALSMLILLIALSYFTYIRMVQVTAELIEVTDFLIPVENLIADINVHALEQEIHLQRVWRLYEIKPINLERIEQERIAFAERGDRVDQDVVEATALLDQAIAHVNLKEDVIALVEIRSLLRNIETAHQHFHDEALEVLEAIEEGEMEIGHLLEDDFEKEELSLDKELDQALLKIIAHTEESANTVEKHERNVLQVSLILLPVAVIVGIFFATIVTFGLMRPLKKLVNGTGQVKQGHLEIELPISTRDEIGELSGIFNQMVRGIREKEQIKATFGQYVDPRIVDSLIHTTGADLGQVDKQVMTVFFSDVAGFSSISEMLTAGGLVNLINQYLTLATEPITRSSGVIDQFIGDAVVAFWGPPFTQSENQAHLACRAALEQFVQLDKLRRRLPELMGIQKGLPEINIRIGLATGELIVGNVGAKQLQSFTVLGKIKTLAEELEGANKIYGTLIMMTDTTKTMAGDSIETRHIGCMAFEGQRIELFELLSLKGELSPEIAQWRDLFEKGLHLYWEQAWEQAQAEFETCLQQNPEDKASKLYLERIEFFKTTPPAKDWDGIWR